MEWMVLGILIIGMAVVLNRRRPDAKAEDAPAEPEAAVPETPEQELHSRMEAFLEEDRFFLVIQPVVDIRTGRVSGGEVLSRLNHPERGVLSPGEFLPVVDALGLYPRFDRYVFQKCCVMQSWSLTEGKQYACLSCNFSRKTLSEEGLARNLIQIADRYGVPHGKLGIEITEQELEPDGQQMLENLQQLKKAGFRIILDDFGGGVTSEKDLTQYPLDIVKIDRSMLTDTGTEQGKTVYRAVVTMAKNLGSEVVCEGIETEEQHRFAKQAGCDYGQGFLFFKPVEQDLGFRIMDESGASRRLHSATGDHHR